MNLITRFNSSAIDLFPWSMSEWQPNSMVHWRPKSVVQLYGDLLHELQFDLKFRDLFQSTRNSCNHKFLLQVIIAQPGFYYMVSINKARKFDI